VNETRTLAILVFDDVEVLDFCGSFEVFSVANRFTDPPAFKVLTVAEKVGPVVPRAASASTRTAGSVSARSPTCCSSPVVRAPARRCTTRR
jgi:hypothetical protein